MATVTLQQIKGSPLTNTEFETNLTNINNETVDNSGVYKLRPSLDVDLVGTKSVSPHMGFSRASIGTYYDGKTVTKAEENLLLRSQEFDNTYWYKARGSLTADSSTAPDGSSTADLLVATATGTYATAYRPSSVYTGGLAYTLSVYAKPVAGQFLILQLNETGTVGRANFDLGTGTVGTVSANATAEMVAVGNGWYRCSVAASPDATSSATLVIGVVDSNTTTAVTNGKSILLWGAQLEQRSQATAYTPTTTQPITNYIPVMQTAAANVARFDHNPMTGESLGLLIEEQRTNLVFYSEQFSDGEWSKVALLPFGSGSVANTAVAPDGTSTADLIIPDTSGPVAHYLRCNKTVTNGTTYTWSVYAKACGYSTLRLRMVGTDALIVTYDLVAGTSDSANSEIKAVGNGWFRCSMTGTANTTSCSVYVYPNSLASYTGDGYSGIYIWGAQLEVGAFPTSYIPTTSVAVTRSADTLTINKNTNWFNSVNGTLALSHDAASGQPILSEGTNTLLTSLGAGITNIDYSNSQLAVVTQSGQTVNTQGIFNFDSDLYVLGNSTSKANAHVKYLKFYPNNVIGSTPSGSGFILDDGYTLLQEDNSVIFQE